MRINGSLNIFFTVLIFSLSACSDKQPSTSSQNKPSSDETMRSMSASIEQTAQSMTVLNPKHDKQYFVDRQVQIIKECIGGSDSETCLREKIRGLRYE